MAVQLISPPPAAEAAAKPKADTAKKSTEAYEPGTGMMLTIKEKVVNLADSGAGATRFVKFAAVVEFAPKSADWHAADSTGKKKLNDYFEKNSFATKAVAEDTIIAAFATKKASELMTPEGRERFRAEVILRLSKAIHEPKVVNVYFTDFVMQ
jgi:flagellar basal body-associated protein FliL